VLATDIYNCTPQRSLGMESPHYHRYHKQPDISFFSAFGCATVVHRGRDLVEHTNLAPRGELGAYLGVGSSHGRRALIVFCPRTSRVYATVDARFDQTYFPFRTSNQRIYGQDYTPSIQLARTAVSLPRHAESDSGQHRQATSKHSRPMQYCLGTYTIFCSCQLPSRSSNRWILKPCAAGTQNPASAGSYPQSLPNQ